MCEFPLLLKISSLRLLTQFKSQEEMKNHDNQNQSNERKIYLKDLHQWVPVSKTDYDNYYRDINAYRRRQQEHGRCVCPASKRYLCDMDCWTCRFHKAGDELSLVSSSTAYFFRA